MILFHTCILCIEDNEDARELHQFLLGQEGFDVASSDASAEDLDPAAQNKFSAIILDYRLDSISGLKIRRRIRIYDRETPISYYSSSACRRIAKQASPLGENADFVKAAHLSRISETVKKLISAR